MNVLIIGGTGVLSSAVTNEALRQGFKVTMINRGSRSNLIPDNVEFLKSDKNDLKKISEEQNAQNTRKNSASAWRKEI